VIGDAVNLTFRIQNESRQANAPVITEALYTRIQELVVVEPLGPVLVKGKELPINIFALKELAVMPAAGCTS
jgi:class 3 adenylate cyclase